MKKALKRGLFFYLQYFFPALKASVKILQTAARTIQKRTAKISFFLMVKIRNLKKITVTSAKFNLILNISI